MHLRDLGQKRQPLPNRCVTYLGQLATSPHTFFPLRTTHQMRLKLSASKREYLCTCLKCKGGRWISKATFYSHGQPTARVRTVGIPGDTLFRRKHIRKKVRLLWLPHLKSFDVDYRSRLQLLERITLGSGSNPPSRICVIRTRKTRMEIYTRRTRMGTCI